MQGALGTSRGAFVRRMTLARGCLNPAFGLESVCVTDLDFWSSVLSAAGCVCSFLAVPANDQLHGARDYLTRIPRGCFISIVFVCGGSHVFRALGRGCNVCRCR